MLAEHEIVRLSIVSRILSPDLVRAVEALLHEGGTLLPPPDDLPRLISQNQEVMKKFVSLFRRLHEEGIRAEIRLIEANLQLVVTLANKHDARGTLIPELIHAGNVGLIGALESYEYRRDYQFSTMAA